MGIKSDVVLLFNPERSHKTLYVECNQQVYHEWDNSIEWIWISRVKYGCFAILIVSKSACYLRYEGQLSPSDQLAKGDEKTYTTKVHSEIIEVFRGHKEVLQNGNLFFVAPLDKGEPGHEHDRTARTLVEQLAQDIETETNMQAEVLRYDSSVAEKWIELEPERIEYSDVEVHFDPEKHHQPKVYFNGQDWL
jgi:hypothetical protein